MTQLIILSKLLISLSTMNCSALSLQQTVREFKTYFSVVFTVEHVDNIPDPVIVHGCENPLRDIDCSEPKAESKLKELNPVTAAGSNGFLPKVLKAVADGVIPHLCQIFNRS